jgi:PilZ domain
MIRQGAGSTLEDLMQRQPAAVDAPQETFRAKRYEIRTIIRFRMRGEEKWREGTTKNISMSGVLFRTDHFVKPSTQIEMKFVLPVEPRGTGAAEVFCRGVVIRSSTSFTEPGSVALAATIAHTRFFRQDFANDLRDPSNGRATPINLGP